MNFQQCYQELANLFDTNAVERVKLWVNHAQHDIMSRRGWSWAEARPSPIALVAAQEAYSVGGAGTNVVTDFGGIIDVTLELSSGGVRIPLIGCSAATFDTYSGPSRVNGTPRFYTVAGGAPDTPASAVRAGGRQELLLWPVPTATAGQGTHILTRYYRSVASVEMTANTDFPILPAEDHYALILGGIVFGYAANGEQSTADAQAARADYEARITAMIEKDQRIKPIRDRLWSDLVAAPAPPAQDPAVVNPRTRPLAAARD